MRAAGAPPPSRMPPHPRPLPRSAQPRIDSRIAALRTRAVPAKARGVPARPLLRAAAVGRLLDGTPGLREAIEAMPPPANNII